MIVLITAVDPEVAFRLRFIKLLSNFSLSSPCSSFCNLRQKETQLTCLPDQFQQLWIDEIDLTIRAINSDHVMGNTQSFIKLKGLQKLLPVL